MSKISTDGKVASSGEDETSSKMNVDKADAPNTKKRRLAYENEGIPSKRKGVAAEPASSDPESEKQRASLKAVPGSALQGAIRESDASGQEQGAAAKPKKDDVLDERLTFPERLMYLLQHEVEPKALWWQKDGMSFAFEPKLFTERVLNKLFPTKIKFESFIRKLNRWGFRRVPGQGLPANGAAYKHPLFKKSDPEQMKKMKFGQKVDTRRPSGHASGGDPAHSAMLADPSQLQALGATQTQNPISLVAMHGAQSAQQLSLLRTLTSAQHQLSPLSPREHLASQAFAAAAGLASSGDANSQLRHRLLLAGLPASLPSLQRPGSTSTTQQLQNLTSSSGRRLSALPTALSSEVELRNALLLGSTLPGSAELQRRLSQSAILGNQGGSPEAAPAGSTLPVSAEIQRRFSQSALVGNQGESPEAALVGSTLPSSAELQRRFSQSALMGNQRESPPEAAQATLGGISSAAGTAAGARSVSGAHLDAMMLLSGSSAGGLANFAQRRASSARLPHAPQVADNFSLLQLRQLSEAELMRLIEQERQRKQDEKSNG